MTFLIHDGYGARYPLVVCQPTNDNLNNKANVPSRSIKRSKAQLFQEQS